VEQFRETILSVLCGLFGGQLPPTNSQPHATAFAAVLAYQIGSPSAANQPVLIGAPHSKEKTPKILAKCSIPYEHREWIVDFYVADRRSTTVELPLLACESEVHKAHGVDYDFSFNSKGPRNGFVWDFRKLLHFRAPKLLFVARVSKGDPDYSRLSTLKCTLRQCAQDYSSVWSSHAELYVVLLPGGQTEQNHASFALSSGGALSKFHPLFP
jgi:hypothetical protein